MLAICIWSTWYAVAVQYGRAAGALGSLLLLVGSPLYGILSQGLWPQVGALVSQALSIAVVAPLLRGQNSAAPRARVRTRYFVGAFFAAWSAACRPTFALWTLAFLVYALIRSRHRILYALAGALLAFISYLWLNLATTGEWFGLYSSKLGGNVTFTFEPLAMLTTLGALLFSTGRGLLLFAPWTVIMFVSVALMFLRSYRSKPWLLVNAFFFLATLLVLCSFSIWWGGWSNGPRLQCDLLLSGIVISGPLLQFATRRLYAFILIMILLVPAAFIQRRSAQMASRPWEAQWTADADMLANMWAWQKGDWLYNALSGQTERIIRNEHREPLVTQSVFNPADPEVQRFFESGFSVNQEKTGFETTMRRANLLFTMPKESEAPTSLLLSFYDKLQWGRLRNLQLLLNGHPLKTIQFLSGSGKTKLLIDLEAKDLAAAGTQNRLTFRECTPTFNEFMDAPICFDVIALLNGTNATKVRANLEGREQPGLIAVGD
jgi:hypothetical protein